MEDKSLWGDDKESPNVFLIRQQYEKARLHLWTNARIARLCKISNITLFELCALAGEYSREKIMRLWKLNRWPMTLVLHFAKWETFIVRYKIGGPQIPDIQDQLLAHLMANKKPDQL